MSRKVFRLKLRNEKRFEILLTIASVESFEREFLLILLCRPEEVIFPPYTYSLSCEQHFAPFLFLSSVLYRKHRHVTYGEGYRTVGGDLCIIRQSLENNQGKLGKRVPSISSWGRGKKILKKKKDKTLAVIFLALSQWMPNVFQVYIIL